MKRSKSASLPAFAGGLILIGLSSAALAVPSPVATGISVPPPDENVAFSTSTTFGPDGLLYAYDGSNVFKETASNGNSFSKISTSAAGVSGSDAGPIIFTRSGSTIVVGTGAGGVLFPNGQGLFLTLPAAGGSFSAPLTKTSDSSTVSIPGQFAFSDLPTSSTVSNAANILAVDSGNGSTSQVSYFNLTTGLNTPVITGIPGASTALTFDNAGHFFVGVGFGSSEGKIKEFNVSDLDDAFNDSSKVIDFSNAGSGTLLNAADNNSGNGMFVADGLLFVGNGTNGLVTVALSPDHTVKSFNLGGENTFITYDSLDDRLALISTDFGPPDFVGVSAASIYNAADFVPEPGMLGVLALGGMTLLRRRIV